MSCRSNERRCDGKTVKDKQCTRQGINYYDGQYLCKTHLKLTKASDQCPICLDNMNRHTSMDICGFGHYFHLNCVAKCPNMCVCPTCKRDLSVSACLKIYEDTDNQLRKQIYGLKSNVKSVLKTQRSLVKFGSITGSDEVDVLNTCIDCLNKLNRDDLCKILNIMHFFTYNGNQGCSLQGIFFVENNGLVTHIESPI